MHIVVTGGAGFIGSALVRLAIRQGHTVLVIDKLTYAGHMSSLSEVATHAGFAFLKADICDSAVILSALQEFSPDAVFHLAAESHVDRSITGAGEFIETNIVGTYRLLQATRTHWEHLKGDRRDRFRFLHVSTDEVYGSLEDDGLFHESTPYDPRSPYSASKAASDHLVSAWGHTYGLPVQISNCSNNYGPYQLPEKLIPLMILNGLDGRDLPIYGDGLNVRDWLHVDDHAHALMMIVEKGRTAETYNIGSRNERSNRDVVTLICDLLDELAPKSKSTREQIRHVTDRPGHDRRYAIDSTKIETQLGWRHSVDFENGLRETIRWYLENEWWWRPLREAGHGLKRLGI